MKKSFLSFILVLISNHALSEIYHTKILSIEAPFIRLENGMVAWPQLDQSEVVKNFLNKNVEITLDDQHNIKKIAPPPLSSSAIKSCKNSPLVRPSVLTSYTEARKVFRRMNHRLRLNSECYNRAHVWAYEEYKRSGLITQKSFLFFTNKYIQNYHLNWWFHVTPLVLVKINGEIKERILDRQFNHRPTEIYKWSRKWVKSGRVCPEIKTYSGYLNHQTEEDCYVIKAPMYFWQPRDLENFEKTGLQKTAFIKEEIEWAYQDTRPSFWDDILAR